MPLFESLGRDHRAIHRVVAALERYLPEVEAGRGSLREDWRFLYFFREFAERYHQTKEEQILFTALAIHGYAEHVGPVAHLREQHARERQLLEELHRLRLLDGADDRSAWVARAREYIGFMRDHVEQENRLLFPAAAKELYFDPRKPIQARMDEFDELELGDGRAEFFVKLADELHEAH